MQKIIHKIFIFILIVALSLPFLFFVGCSAKLDTKGIENATGTSPYGFVEQVNGYIYFINGVEEYSASNKYGKVTKGALMRVKTEDGGIPENSTAEMVIPELVVSSDYKSGIVIFDGYIYYATPNTTRNLKGEIESNYLNFKRARLDGSKPEKFFARTNSNSTEYRYVKIDNEVYLVYLDTADSTRQEIHAYNIRQRVDRTLVRGYNAAILAEDNNAAAKYVYYTMKVVNPVMTDGSVPKTYNSKSKEYTAPTTFDYEQLYRVDITTDKPANKITPELLREGGYVAQDNSVLEYLNYGELVLDGIGLEKKTVFNDINNFSSLNAKVVQSQINFENNGADVTFNFVRYFSKQNYEQGTVDGSFGGTVFIQFNFSNESGNKFIYTLNEAKFVNEKANGSFNYYPVAYSGGNGQTGSQQTGLQIHFEKAITPVFLKLSSQDNAIIQNAVVFPTPSTTFSATPVGFTYIARGGSTDSPLLMMNTVTNGNSVDVYSSTTTKVLAKEGVVADTEPLFVYGDYLYFNTTGNSGKKIYKVQIKGGAVNPSVPILEIEYKSDWYKPEILKIGTKEYLFYANASTYGENYITYVENLNDTHQKEKNEQWKTVQDAIDRIETEYSKLVNFQPYSKNTANLAKLYFYTGINFSNIFNADGTLNKKAANEKFAGRTLVDYYNKLVEDKQQIAVTYADYFIHGERNEGLNFEAVKNINNERYFYTMIGSRANSSTREKDIATALLPILESAGWTWQWWALFVPIGVVVATGVGVAVFFIVKKKKEKRQQLDK